MCVCCVHEDFSVYASVCVFRDYNYCACGHVIVISYLSYGLVMCCRVKSSCVMCLCRYVYDAHLMYDKVSIRFLCCVVLCTSE